jgi:hypothetical protein
MPKRKKEHMPATVDIRLPVTPDENEAIKRRAGGAGVAAYLRKLLGLPERKPGRPPKVLPREKRE